MTPSRRSFIRGLAALVVLPKLPVAEAAEEVLTIKKLGAPAVRFDPYAYVGTFKWVNINHRLEPEPDRPREVLQSISQGNV